MDLSEETQVLIVTYERIREVEEATELSTLIQASSFGAMRKRV